MKDLYILVWIVALVSATVASLISVAFQPEPQLVSHFVCVKSERGHCLEYKEYKK